MRRYAAFEASPIEKSRIKNGARDVYKRQVDALNKQSTEKVRINIIHGGTGAITESDILLASASDAIIIGFNVRPTAKVKEMAEHESVDIRFRCV